MRKTILAIPVLLALLACAPPQLTPDQQMALRQAQTREFEAPEDIAFGATLGYLQDNFYQVRQASKDTGFISAFKAKDLSGGEKFWGAFFIGGAAKKGDSYEVTFTFDPVDAAHTKVRVNITHGVYNLAGAATDVQPVTEPMLYKGLLDALTVEVQRRRMTRDMLKATATPEGGAQAVPAPASPAGATDGH